MCSIVEVNNVRIVAFLRRLYITNRQNITQAYASFRVVQPMKHVRCTVTSTNGLLTWNVVSFHLK